MIKKRIVKTIDILNGEYNLNDIEYDNFLISLKSFLLYNVFGIFDINKEIMRITNTLSESGFKVDFINPLPKYDIYDLSKHINQTYLKVSMINKSKNDFVCILKADIIIDILNQLKIYNELEPHIESLSLSVDKQVILDEGEHIISMINKSLNKYITSEYEDCEFQFQSLSSGEIVTIINQFAAYYNIDDDEIII